MSDGVYARSAVGEQKLERKEDGAEDEKHSAHHDKIHRFDGHFRKIKWRNQIVDW
jgi:hypothetical protein